MSTAENEQFVPLEIFQKLQSKMKRKEEEIKKYKELLTSYTQNINMIEESFKSYNNMFNDVQIQIDTLKEKQKNCSNCKELRNQIVNIQTSMKEKEAEFASSCKPSKNELFYLRKMEDAEIEAKELQKQFEIMTSKYTVLLEEKILIEDDKKRTEEQFQKISSKYAKKSEDLVIAISEVKKYKSLIERFRQIDECLVENSMKTYFMNTKIQPHQEGRDFPSSSIATHQHLNQVKGVENASYIMCEPMPSIVKFIANDSKIKASKKGNNNDN